MIERAERLPHVKTLAVLADALGVALSQMFPGVDGPEVSSATTELPLIAYLESRRLDSSDIDALLIAAKLMFGDRRSQTP